jgi:hypothetical protein
MPRANSQEIVDCNPAAWFQRQAQALWLMAQMLAEKPADADDTLLLHDIPHFSPSLIEQI